MWKMYYFSLEQKTYEDFIYAPLPHVKKRWACFSLWFLEEDNINQGKAKSAGSLAVKRKTSQG